ncbi:hypothetical protein F5878DRAFT_632752 [Lentinula raphanica]|uniref:Uncharacterized protein n=1 Tax=Lentinula raphanica TaxID=153919 RepID=A0AA38NZC6_9AGAR|nr:hypothetical protein F5878DRAFT_632752 [Lentinula raphanica]
METLEATPLTIRGGSRTADKFAFPAANWLYFVQRSRHVLILGIVDGRLQPWDYVDERMALECTRNVITPSAAPALGNIQVVSIDVFPKEVPVGGHAQVVASFTNRSIWIGTLKADGELTQVALITLEEGFLPKTVRFDTTSANILAFAFNGGNVALIDSRTGNILWRKGDAPKIMGSVSLDDACSNFIACTPQGFELWNLENMARIKKFEQLPVLLSMPKHAWFSEQNTKVIGGTDRGCAEVYHVATGRVEQSLPYYLGGLVQSVATCIRPEGYLVAVAGSNGHQPCDVILWYKTKMPTRVATSSQDSWTWNCSFQVRKKHVTWTAYTVLVVLVILGYSAILVLFNETISYGLHQIWPF